MNGYNSLNYRNGITYEGYFLNDFIYCHKDSLMSCLKGLPEENKLDIGEFFLKVKKFEGEIIDCKIKGKAKVLYKNNDLY